MSPCPTLSPYTTLFRSFIPSPMSIENYQGVFSAQNNFGRSLINSVIVAGTTTILTLLFGIIGAYALARLRFRGKVGVLWLIMACSMFPLVVLLPPLLKLFSSTEPFTWFPDRKSTRLNSSHLVISY